MRFIIIISMLVVYTNCDDYYAKRAKFLDQEFKLGVGGNTTLDDKESIVNNCLMTHKIKEIDYGINNPDFYNFSHHYFSYKNKIVASKVYKIIKEMPKGAILHVHDTAILGADYMLNITYMDNLYVCFGQRVNFSFSNNVPKAGCDVHWQLMSEVRKSAKDITKFDAEIKKHFTVAVENPDVMYPGSKDIWMPFSKYFGSVYGLLSYKPVRKQYIYDILKAFKKDNIIYAELRSSLLPIHELNGTVCDNVSLAKMYREVINTFIKENPDFFGTKLIVTSSRKISNIDSQIRIVRKLKTELPELIIGFDLIGQEDMGRPLLNFVSVLKTVKDLHFFFHAGETNWYGTAIDENLIDAVLLGTKRIGHAYALTKHPLVMKEVIDRDIAIEVNVVSNAVLSLVRDVRNHPLSMFLSHGLPVVLSSDDPGAWGADPLSDDFYVAFMGVASKHADLRMLKTLALNSLKYSALDTVNKQKAVQIFNAKWNHFVNSFKCPQ